MPTPTSTVTPTPSPSPSPTPSPSPSASGNAIVYSDTYRKLIAAFPGGYAENECFLRLVLTGTGDFCHSIFDPVYFYPDGTWGRRPWIVDPTSPSGWSIAPAPATPTPTPTPTPPQYPPDQQQTATDARFAVAAATWPPASLAQTFTAGASGLIESVSLYVGCCADPTGVVRGLPPGHALQIGIRELDSQGMPTGTSTHGFAKVWPTWVSTDGSMQWLNVPLIHRCDQPEWNNCNPVTAGSRYAIVIGVSYADWDEPCDPDGGWPDCGYQLGRTAPGAYSAGEGLGFWGAGWSGGVYLPGAWHREDRHQPDMASYDLAFKTYIRPL
jgi:hypothetical protein